METHSTFDIPLESLSRGVHAYVYQLTDDFFSAFETELLQGGSFNVNLEVERIRNQFSLKWKAAGHAHVSCDRCLEVFALPLEVEDEILVKFDNEQPRIEEEVIYVPFGTERFNVAKILYDSIGLAVPMSKVHELADLECDPTMTKYLRGDDEQSADADTDNNSDNLPEDSPWSVLRQLGSQDN